jgi:xanthine dehydrogenase YagS FAD-binding subunit
MSGGSVEDARIVCGAVQCTPMRVNAAERLVRGQTRSASVAEAAGAASVQGAEPLAYNGYKIPLMQNLVKRAVRGA